MMMHFKSLSGSHTHVFLLSAALALAAGSAFGQQTTIIARTGDAAPEGNGVFASFINDPVDPDSDQAFGPTLNDAGQVAFPGFLGNTSGGGSDNSGLYFYDGAGIVKIAREGEAPPDGDGAFNRFNTRKMAAVSNDGTVAFSSALTGSASGEFFEWGVYVYQNDTLTQVIRQGDVSPDGDSTIQFVFPPSTNEAGRIAFTGEFDAVDPVGERGLFRDDMATDAVTVLTREGIAPPNNVGSFNLIIGGALNDAGQVVFNAAINSNTVDDRGIFRVEADGSTITHIARVGDPSPDSGEYFQSFNSEGYENINDLGQVVFGAYLTDDAAMGYATSAGIFLYDDGTVVPLARTGQPGPGSSIFVGFALPGHLTVAPALNNAGQAAFYGYIELGAYIYGGIFRVDGTPGGATEIVRQDQHAPDGNGVFLLDSTPFAFDSNDAPKMNEAGQVAFYTNLNNTAGEITDDEGIFFYDDELGLLQVAREGYPLLGSTIKELRFTPRGSVAHANDRSGLNNRGQIAYAFELADGTGGIALWTPPGSTAAGDLNGDGCVNLSDLGSLLASYGHDSGGDIDGDGQTDLADLGILLAHYGMGC